MYCKHCGYDNSYKTKWCFKCGNPIENTEGVNDGFSSRKKSKVIIAIIAIVAFVTALCIPKFVSMIKDNNNAKSHAITIKSDGIRMFNITADEFVDKWNSLEHPYLPQLEKGRSIFELKKGNFQVLLSLGVDEKTGNVLNAIFHADTSDADYSFFIDCYGAALIVLTNDQSEKYQNSYDKIQAMLDNESEAGVEYRDGDVYLIGTFVGDMALFAVYPDYKNDSENPIKTNR